MIRKHKKTLILTSLLTLLPILAGLLLKDKLPDMMITHMGINGQPDSWSDATTAIFLLPLILLAVHWLLLLLTSKDKSNQDRNEKLQTIVLWTIPILSNFCCGTMYAVALDVDFSMTSLMFGFMGLLFAIMGNYMPKCKMNATIGIKVYWAYTSEENWNATHRLAGKFWFIGGILMLFSALLPGKLALAVFLAVTAVMVIVPILYSWLFYRKQVQEGVELMQPLTNPKAKKQSGVAIAIVLVLVCGIIFFGDFDVILGDSSFTIDASLHSDITVSYDSIAALELREGNVEGMRVMGVGTAKLLLGTFENEEFGRYTRYTYTNPKSCIVLTADNGKVLVFCGKNARDTLDIYNYLTAKIQ